MEEKTIKIEDMNATDAALVNFLKEMFSGWPVQFGILQSSGCIHIIEGMDKDGWGSCCGEIRHSSNSMLNFLPEGYEMIMGDFGVPFDKNVDYVTVRKSEIQVERIAKSQKFKVFLGD